VTMLRYRNRGTQAAVSAKAENTENTRQLGGGGCSSGFFAAFSFEFCANWLRRDTAVALTL